MLLALVLAASGVSFFSGPELSQQPQRVLKQHLVEVDAELYALQQSIALTAGDVFGKASGDAAPAIAIAGVPALLLGLVVKNGTSGAAPLIQTSAIVATALFVGALVAGLIYAIARVISHGFDVAQWTEREKQVTAYRPLVVNALRASSTPRSQPPALP